MDHGVGRSPIQAWARALANIAPLRRQPSLTMPRLIDRLADQHGDRPALQNRTALLTYRGLAQRKNRFAHWAFAQKLGRGDTVCLLMENCPDYIAMWLGTSQTGAAVALINTRLRGAALIQAIVTSKAGHIVAGAAHVADLEAVRASLDPGLVCWAPGPKRAAAGLHALDLAAYADAPAPHAAIAADTALLVFTSGTTGMPKAARISHYRVLEWSYWFAGMMNTGLDDVLYDCLPLHHSTGGVAGPGGVLVAGGTVILRERFSIAGFWPDVSASRCTVFLYIGELCRYLLSAQPDPAETTHTLRLCCGNGLSGDVWQDFQARFRVPQILEFYAATEGNVSLYNVEGKPGAIGRIPPILRPKFPVALIATDPETGDALRDAAGHCTVCAQGETGEAIGRIISAGNTAPDSFEGYTDPEATERKVLRDVFAAGDAWFRTGDLMRQDDSGFYYFVDRIGDTFRWKGENVSALQVAGVLCRYPGIAAAVVYGVAIPGEDGRAGMAAIMAGAEFQADGLYGFLSDNLAPFAVPLFVRICAELEMTATFKPVTARLVRDGFGSGVGLDPVYRLDAVARRYVRKEAILF